PHALARVLCCHRYAEHPDLHSFPTRRSSDLSGSPLENIARQSGLPPGACPPKAVRTLAFSRATSFGVQPQRTSLAHPATTPGGTDRKSTRLNSSHVKISYAVFCLKKKKNSYD